ncbi:uncharacterized protein [Triticum aestivum]|uniref:uncharacterized protein n=1 Tax=Triticum aestivum TaxID=4565 RepID=UPI001D030242|nr:uncharacterized protein LOC123135364 [Triticum aestivum]XP_044410341.1 uncharacterized protein LOC123135368 [Triticum aestivum]
MVPNASDIEKVKAAVRQAIDTHPNHPTLHLSAYGRPQTDDEEESDSEQTKQEFLLGSMESLECIDIRVRVLNVASTGFDFIGSLGNLPSLKRVGAYIDCNGANASDIEKVNAALRQAIDTHPNRPTLDLHPYGLSQTDEEELDSKQTEQEVIPPSSLHYTTYQCWYVWSGNRRQQRRARSTGL